MAARGTARGALGAAAIVRVFALGLAASAAIAAEPIATDRAVADAAHIGVYADSAGTRPCASIDPNTPTTLYVVATLDGPLARGIRGAEFRLEMQNPQGWFVMYQPPRDALHVGNPVDADGQECLGAGITLAFTTCRPPDVASNRVSLGTVLVTNAGGRASHLLVKRHIRPGNANFSCPLLIECNDPRNEKHCVQPVYRAQCASDDVLAAGPPGYDAAYFVTALNTPIDARPFATSPRDPQRELVVQFRAGALRLPEGDVAVPLDDVAVHAADLRHALEAARVAEIGVAFPASGACAPEAEARYAASVANVALLRFNHARTARRALEELQPLEAVEFVAPATDFVVPRETVFWMSTDLQEGRALTKSMSFAISLTKPARLLVELVDVSGHVRATLYDALVPAGTHTVAAAADGSPVPSGLYVLRMRAGGQEATYKVVMADE